MEIDNKEKKTKEHTEETIVVVVFLYQKLIALESFSFRRMIFSSQV